MKLEPLFTSKENRLFTINGEVAPTDRSVVVYAKDLSAVSPVPAALSSDGRCPLLVRIAWEEIGLDESCYNEELLANLRDFLKVLDEQGLFAVIIPSTEKISLDDAQKEEFIASCKHCARRIKDCKSVIGFAIPKEVDAASFMEELSQKHAHYVYFSKSEEVLANPCVVRY